MVRLTDAQGSHNCHQVGWRKRSPGGARFQRPSKSPGEGAGVFLRVFTECALATLALKFWACGKEMVVPTRQTWSGPQLPEIMDEAVCLPVETERQEHAGGSPALSKADSTADHQHVGRWSAVTGRIHTSGSVTTSASIHPHLRLLSLAQGWW